MITCLLLSAGLSQRFGSPKALADLNGRKVIEHLQDTLLETSCDEIIIVLGAWAQEIQPSIFIHSRIRVVYNKDYNLGQLSSVQAGWRQADGHSKAVMFLPVDCPMVKASSLSLLIEHFKKSDPDVLIPTYQNKKGHPLLLSQRLKSEALDIPLNLGLNSLFAKHPGQTLEINDPGIIKSFNTPQEFEAIKNLN